MIADVEQKFTPNHTVPVNNVGHYLGPHYVSKVPLSISFIR